jgi:hypothetical protein
MKRKGTDLSPRNSNLVRESSIGRYPIIEPINEDEQDDTRNDDARNVRQRRNDVDLPPINPPSNNDIIVLLTQLGHNISLVADQDRQAPEQVESVFESIKSELDSALDNAFNEAKRVIKEREQLHQERESMGMGAEEVSQNERLKQQFFADLEKITQRMSSELTYGEQSRMFRIVVEALTARLDEYSLIRATQIEKDHLERVAEIASIAYAWASTQLSVTITNIYETAPQVTKQLMAIITSIGIIYNYLPESIRNPLVNVPYLGNLFSIMNRANNDALLIQNSAATVTSIYYLLRNAGMDPTDSITALGSMAESTAVSCARTTGSFVSSNVSKAMGRLRESTGNAIFVCRNVSSNAITNLRKSAENVLLTIGSKLGDILTDDYSKFAINDSQQTDISIISIGSARTVNSAQMQNSATSQQSIEIVESLLNTPIERGGIDIGGYIPANVLEERFEPIVEGLVTDPIIANPMEMIVADTEAVPVLERIDSISTISSQNSENNDWSVWLFGRSHAGGKRFRKSRRHLKLKKTRKGRGKKARISKKRRHMKRHTKRHY